MLYLYIQLQQLTPTTMTTTKNITFEQNITAFKQLVKDAPQKMSDVRIQETLICSKTGDCQNCLLGNINCEFTHQTASERINFIAGVLTERGVIL